MVQTIMSKKTSAKVRNIHDYFVILHSRLKKYMNDMKIFVKNVLLVLLMVPLATMTKAQTEEFTISTLNVDGLPTTLMFIPINIGGPGETWTPKISEYLAGKAYDLVAVQENFSYHNELCSKLDDYLHDAWNGPMAIDKLGSVDESRMPFDGLNLFWRKDITGQRKDSVKWERSCGGLLDHCSDSLVTKGFRRYELTLKGGAELVVYDLHADATSESDELTGEDLPDRHARYHEMVQLRSHILDRLDKRPVIVLGDFNCYYSRDTLKAQFIDYITNTGRATVGDVMVQLELGGVFPEMKSTDGLPTMKDDSGNDVYVWTENEELDKIIYINPVGGGILTPLEYGVDKDGYVRENGSALGDHWPVMAKFSISQTATAIRSVTSTASGDTVGMTSAVAASKPDLPRRAFMFIRVRRLSSDKVYAGRRAGDGEAVRAVSEAAA